MPGDSRGWRAPGGGGEKRQPQPKSSGKACFRTGGVMAGADARTHAHLRGLAAPGEALPARLCPWWDLRVAWGEPNLK